MNAERLNPLDQALVLASGRSIYIWDYDKPQFIARRTGRVRDLTVYKDRLVDVGNYDGVRETLSGWPISGRGAAWDCVTSADVNGECLVGGMGHEAYGAPINYGIWDIEKDERIMHRGGPTKILHGSPFLMDGGDYIFYENQQDNLLIQTLDNKVLFNTSIKRPVTAVADWNGGFGPRSLIANGLNLYLLDPLEDHTHSAGYQYHNDRYALWKQFSQIERRFMFEAGERPFLWQQFCQLYQENKAYALKTVEVKSHDLSGYPGELVKVKSEDYEVAQRRIGDLVRFMNCYANQFLDMVYTKEAITGIQQLGPRELVLGTNSGRLELISKGSDQLNTELIHQFREPISTVLGIPREVYNDGLRDKVVREVTRKAYFAKAGRKVVSLSRAA
jgi:hypothetical protein